MQELLFWIIIAIIVLGFISDQVIGFYSNKGWNISLPSVVKPHYSDEKYNTARNYHLEGDKVSLLKSSISLIVLLAILFTGGFDYLDSYVRGISESATIQMLLFFAILFILGDVFSFPFQWYSTFTIEEKYGFNKTSVSTFLIDKVKGWLIAIVIGGGLLLIIFKIYESTLDYFWLLAWIVVSAFSLFMALFYTKLLLPIFNKLSPLEEGELKDAITKVASNTGFKLDKIMVMDGSKRSSKANAFFSGLGRQKSIVLYDTLIEQHTQEELLAVLAHEIGHYKLKHIPQSIILSLLQSLMTFYILGAFLKYPIFTQVIGFSETSFYASLIAFGLLYSPVELILGIFTNMLSRKNEYQADLFAADQDLGIALKDALVKMSAHHLSNLYPNKIEVFLNYSHPTLIQRITNLNLSKNESISASSGV